MSLMSKYVQIKDEVGQLYRCLFKKTICGLNFIQWPCTTFLLLSAKLRIVTVDPGSNPDHDKLGGEIGKVIVRRVY
jgi:hypothetical protein